MHHTGATVKQNSLVEQELHKFWKLLDATLDEVITVEKKPFIPDQLLSKALQLYWNHYKQWFGKIYCSDPRTLLFVQRVLGYDGIQRIMPVNYIQSFSIYCCYPHDILKKPQHRSTLVKVRVHADQIDEIDFYPLKPRSSWGFNFFTDGGSLDYLPWRAASGAQSFISDLMSLKENGMTELMPQITRTRLWPF